MKKTLLIAFATALIMSACNKDSGQAGQDYQHASTLEKNLALYEKAKKNGDAITSIVALNYVLLEDSANLQYSDSLARLYMESGQLEPGIALGDKVLKEQPENNSLLEMVAKGKFQTGNFEGSSADFNVLYDRLGKVEYLYQLAAIDFYSQKYDKCMEKSEKILQSPKVDSSVVDFMTQEGGVQRIPLRAATHYVRGMVHIARSNATQAGVELRKSLQISPNFQEAQYRYSMVTEYQKNMAEELERQKAQKKFNERFGQ